MDLLCKTAFLLPERVPEREQNPDGPRPWASFVPTHLFTAIAPDKLLGARNAQVINRGM